MTTLFEHSKSLSTFDLRIRVKDIWMTRYSSLCQEIRHTCKKRAAFTTFCMCVSETTLMTDAKKESLPVQWNGGICDANHPNSNRNKIEPLFR